eukprot:GHVQ01005189.1.p3 GENE.GHVQ01005189.1~~GHVQ01005189.1.p3  ORF type:complete len:167 (-),score=13.58 GHVQ01005189.1:755-1255(-)
MMSSLIKRYDIKPLGKDRSNTVITMGRIYFAFPQYNAQYLSLGVGRVVGEVPDKMMYYLCFLGAAALITDENTLKLHRLWAYTFNELIKVDQPTEDDTDYIGIAYNSSMLSMDMRHNLLATLDKQKTGIERVAGGKLLTADETEQLSKDWSASQKPEARRIRKGGK